MKKILITGSNGFLGQHLALFLQGNGYEVVGVGKGNNRQPDTAMVYRSVDLTNEHHVEELLKETKPDVVVHTAAMSKPDECNNDRKLCYDINVGATQNLLRYSGSSFIYLSTDFVFGEGGPHAETDAFGPLNYYGESKLMAEELTRKSGLPYAIVRPVFIYGKVWPGLRPSFLQWVANCLQQDKNIKVVSDQVRTPTYVTDICSGIKAIINQNETGDFHLAGNDLLSPYEMAIITARVLGLDESLIENVTSETFPEPVARAKRSGLKIDKAQKVLNYHPVSFAEGVRLSFN